ncbi:GPI transamidase subunit PIG-U [Lipomyces arxii]|uniref:GPI transamidase subunit PIG-U n=1 Tax=Lipomyces arxii TaxID=56418 RepID=UPI0034CD1023
MDLKIFAVMVAGAAIRLSLSLLFPSLHAVLDQRVEITTTMTSFKQLREGFFLYNLGVSPYDGGVYHQAPALLYIFEQFEKYGSTAPESCSIMLFYCILDLMAGYYLYKISKSSVFAKTTQLKGWIITSIYVLNPLVIVTGLARSTAVLSNTILLGAIAYATTNTLLFSAIFLALASHINFYMCYLVPPMLVLWTTMSNKYFSTIALTVYIAVFGMLALGGYYMTGSWQYIQSSYGYILFFGDLVPNMGLWWYFFMEMFDFFRPLFTYVFQLYSLIYVLPITIRLHKQPLFAMTTILGITAISKPYPEMGDLAVYISLLSVFYYLFPNIRYVLLSAFVVLHSLVLAPSFYHLWIYLGSGNANFFYAITLVYTVGVSITIADSLRAMLRVEFDGGENPSKMVVLM